LNLVYLYIFLTIVLIVVIYQDLKNRAIHISLPIVIFAVALVINNSEALLDFKTIVLNVSFILVNIIGLFAYASIKAKTFVNPINKSIGIGDIAFFFCITPLFNLRTFIIFFILGLIFSLVVHAIFKAFKKTDTIPLAGYLSLFLVCNLLAENIFNTSFL